MKKHIILSFLAILFLLFGISNINAKSERAERKVRVLARSEEEINKGRARGCEVVRKARALIALRCSDIAAAELGLPEDVRFFKQDSRANTQIGASVVHSSGNTGAGRKVAVLDTGYNYNHPELSSSYFAGRDFVNDDNDPMDDEGHGSHVAGIITADGVDSKAKGVAPDATVVAVKVLDQNGSGFFSDIVAAIYWVADGYGLDGVASTSDDFTVDAINMSLGTSRPYVYKNFCDSVMPEMTSAIKYAVDRGIVVVSASGNSGSAGVSIPGCISHSTTVGAVNSSDKIANFSGRGGAVDITSPGVSIYSSVLGAGYASWSGTSMATPMITATVVLIKYAKPWYYAFQVQNALLKTVKDLGKAGWDSSFGWGRVRADAAVNY